jgi:hypothetical protein
MAILYLIVLPSASSYNISTSWLQDVLIFAMVAVSIFAFVISPIG